MIQPSPKCMDKALKLLGMRMHSRAELRKKLIRGKFEGGEVESVLEKLTKAGYLDDAKFAVSKAMSSAQHKHHGKRRAAQELMKSGVDTTTARKALEDVYEAHDSMAVARELARKKAPSLKRLDSHTARRRLYGLLLRRGFNYEEIRPVVEEVLGTEEE